MSDKFKFYYDESEHSRKINNSTIMSNNYYDNFIATIVGWKSEQVNDIEKRYLSFEDKYSDRKSKGELKSSTIKNKQIKYGFASLSIDNALFLKDFFGLFDNNVHLYFSVISKIEYVINQIFQDYKSNLTVDSEMLKYSLVKSIVLYQPKEIIEGIYESTNELTKLLRKFLNDRIALNKKNLPLKEHENEAFNQILMILNDVNKNFTIDWEYRIAFYGFKKYLDEMGITEYSLIIDQEGEESKTLLAARSTGLMFVKEEDSKDNVGIRWADMLAGIISKFLKIMHSHLEYTSFEDGINKKLLCDEWFKVNQAQLDLYKQLSYIISQLNNAWYKSFAGLYSDDLILFLNFINYMAHFESASEIQETSYEIHAEYVNGAVIKALEDYFSRLKSKLPIELVDKTEDEFFVGKRGQKIYFEDSKQPRLELKEGSQTFYVLAVGFSKNNKPSVTIFENKEAICYRIPDELFDWALSCVSLANMGEKIFPSKVNFTKRDNGYLANIQ